MRGQLTKLSVTSLIFHGSVLVRLLFPHFLLTSTGRKVGGWEAGGRGRGGEYVCLALLLFGVVERQDEDITGSRDVHLK